MDIWINYEIFTTLDLESEQLIDMLISLTSAVGIDHETLVDMVLDEKQSLLKDLAGTSLLHSVRVTWVTEKRK